MGAYYLIPPIINAARYHQVTQQVDRNISEALSSTISNNPDRIFYSPTNNTPFNASELRETEPLTNNLVIDEDSANKDVIANLDLNTQLAEVDNSIISFITSRRFIDTFF
jgi:hypothetical protein